MDAHEIRVELSIRSIEFEQALDRGLPSSQLREIYNNLKELQYQLALAEAKESESRPAPPDTIVLE